MHEVGIHRWFHLNREIIEFVHTKSSCADVAEIPAPYPTTPRTHAGCRYTASIVLAAEKRTQLQRIVRLTAVATTRFADGSVDEADVEKKKCGLGGETEKGQEK